MSYDSEVEIRLGSVWPLYAEAELPEGATAQILSDPGAVVTLYTEAGIAVPGFSSVPVSGADAGPESALRVWYLLNTANPALVPGVYSALFTFSVGAALSPNGDELPACRFEIDVRVTLLGPVEVVATYDDAQLTTSALYQTRFHACDTSVANAIWSDAELNYLLIMSGGNPLLAAANALEALAVDRARLSNAVRIGAFGNGEMEAYQAIAERAKRLRSLAPMPPVVRPPDRVFVPSNRRLRERGNMENW